MEQEIDIKALRRMLCMTQTQLAEEMGVDQSTVSNWESGDTRPRGPARKLLASLMVKAERRLSRLGETA